MATRRNRWKMLPTATLAVFPFTAFAPSAQAFFPPVSQSPGRVAVIDPPPRNRPIDTINPVPPLPTPTPHPTPPPDPPPHCDCGSPHTVPEPSTLVAGIVGLTTAAGWAARRRQASANKE